MSFDRPEHDDPRQGRSELRVADAKHVARRWVNEVAVELPGFEGAFFHGSIHEMSDEDPFPTTSDVDVGVVLAGPEPNQRLGKTRRGGVLVEAAGIAADRVATAEQLLRDYRLGPSFRRDGVISDPTGHLAHIQREVECHFTERRFVLARCDDAKANCLGYANGLDAATPYYVQAICWLFAEGNLAHVLLAAGLRNPTVRRRYAAARELLESAGRLDVHETLLRMLGCGTMNASRAEHHLEGMTQVFDRAASAMRSAFPFAPDLSEAARPAAVEGSRALIERGEHREAVFWIAVTWARCLAVLETDVPEEAGAHAPGFRALLEDLGVVTFEDMRRRATEIEAFLPELMVVAGDLVSAHPDIGG